MAKTPAPWSDKKFLLAQLQKLWDRGLLLREQLEPGDLFPKRLLFKAPGSKALGDEFAAVRSWIAEIDKAESPGGLRIVRKTVRHRVIGENRIPAEAWVDDLAAAVSLLHKQSECERFTALAVTTRERTPQLLDWVKQHPLKALSLAEDWPRLLDFVSWRQQHASPAIYLRQVCLPGIDSKFLEQHRAVLSALLDLTLTPQQIDDGATGIRQFEQRYGFRGKPQTVRLRLLDSELTLLAGPDNDISMTAADFQALPANPGLAGRIRRVLVTENEINFLAFPPQAQSLVVFGAGYGFDALAQADWLADMDIVYWGDIDTHGFAILDQLRSKFPQVQSMLMDEQTLLAHREFWGRESTPGQRQLPRLTPAEQALYQALLGNNYAECLRLEQERIAYDHVLAALARL